MRISDHDVVHALREAGFASEAIAAWKAEIAVARHRAETLRDKFACEVLGRLIVHGYDHLQDWVNAGHVDPIQAMRRQATQMAYEVADVMLEARDAHL
jgi:hypothetical protein